MILSALFNLYERRMRDPDPARRLAALGFEQKPIPFILELNREGQLVNLTDTRSSGKKPLAQSFLVPQGVKKTSGVASNLMWDTVEYALGIDTRGKPERVVEQHAAFRAALNALPDSAKNDPGVIAINMFLDQISLDQLT